MCAVLVYLREQVASLCTVKSSRVLRVRVLGLNEARSGRAPDAEVACGGGFMGMTSQHRLMPGLQALYGGDPPSWWPLDLWDRYQIDKKESCLMIHRAMRQHFGLTS